MAISEYDAFGPWIYEIDEEHPAPRLFAPYIPRNETARILLKIPRNIERRRATPDMDLYDYVIGAYAEHICILKREEQRVTKTRIPYSDIEGLELKRHFLAGTLTFYLKKGSMSVPFNTVSVDMVKGLAAYIRDRLPNGDDRLSETIRERQTEIELNLLFTNLLHDLREDGETPLLYGYQPTVERVPESGGLQGLLARFRHQKEPAALHVVTPRELIVIRQDVTEEKHSKEEFTYHYYYLPIAAIKESRIEKHGEHGECVCVVSLSDHSFSFKTDENHHSVLVIYELLKKTCG